MIPSCTLSEKRRSFCPTGAPFGRPAPLLAPQLPKAAVEVQFAGLGALDHGGEVAAGPARKVALGLGRDDGERHRGTLPAYDPAGLAPKRLGHSQFMPQGGAGGIDDVAPVGEGEGDMVGQPRRELDELLRMELLDPFKGPERDAIFKILPVRLFRC